MKKIFTSGTVFILVVLIGMQLIPLNRTNPPVTREVQWNSVETRDLAKQACFDCHSNETTWPWYSRVAPVSFWLVNHIYEGRSKLNFSEWDRSNEDFDEVEEKIRDGEMPPLYYLPVHPEARLSQEEKQRLVNGLRLTYQQDPPVDDDRRGGDD